MTFQQYWLYANWKNCELEKLQIQYLGHVISHKGLEMDPGKISAIHQWPSFNALLLLNVYIQLCEDSKTFDTIA